MTLKSEEGGDTRTYVAGYPSNMTGDGSSRRKLCGTEDRENAACYVNSHPTEYKKAKAALGTAVYQWQKLMHWLASG